MLGVELWKEGASQTIFSSLNRIGLSQSVDAVRGRIDKIVASADKAIKSCQTSLQVSILCISKHILMDVPQEIF